MWDAHDDEEAWWRAETSRRALRRQELRAEADPERRAQRIHADLMLCSRDFLYWAQNYAWMYDPTQADPVRRKVPFVAWPRQREFILWLDERTAAGEMAVVPKGRELGVTWICLFRLFWAWRFESGFSALLGSRKQELVDRRGDFDSLFEKLRWLLLQQPEHLHPGRHIANHCLLKHQDLGSELVGEATNPAFGQGKRRRVALIDEAARVDPNVFQSTWLALETAAHSVWLVYNPGAKGHLTYELHHGEHAVDRRLIFEMDWTTDPRRGDDWKRSKLRPQGRLTPEEFASAHECQYGYVRTGKIWDVRWDDIEYHADDPAWRDRSERVRQVAPQVAGWDFGSGASALVCLFGLLELGDRPILWIDQERIWQQTSWRTAGADVHAASALYGGRPLHFGDPAGKAKESDQKSWETNLRSAGVPLFCLDAWFNTRDGIEWGFKWVQSMLDEGRLRVHRRCRYLRSCLESWRRDIPEGLTVDVISRAYIGPRHDEYSHGGHALRYLWGGAALLLAQERRRGQSSGADVPSVPQGATAQILSALQRR
ncbi:MAG: hypothetical protein AAGD06_30460 [Acidobacteriota bacterium]